MATTICLLSLYPMEGKTQIRPDGSIHWAYASYFGTGWYNINDERRAFVLRGTPRWQYREAEWHEDGSRTIGINFRMPLTVGLQTFDFRDIPDALDPENLTTVSLNASVDFEIPINARWSVRPTVEGGYGRVLDGSDSAWTYKTGIRSQYRFQHGKLDWALIAVLGYVGYSSKNFSSDDFTFGGLALEFGYPLGWLDKEGAPYRLYWHAGYMEMLDEVEFGVSGEPRHEISNYWDAGLAIGKTGKPIEISFLRFDRLGLAYRVSKNGSLKGVSVIFRSLFEI